MTKKATLSPITGSPVSQIAAINSALDDINDKLDNTLSRDGSTPNAMEADFDLNSNDLLNGRDLYAQSLYLNGTRLVPDTTAIGVVITPFDFGAKGDGTTDDTAAVNSCFEYIRARTDANIAGIPYVVDGLGRHFLVGSVNATGLARRGWAIRNMILEGNETGKPVLDLSASRRGYISNVFTWGNRSAEPSVGFLLARTEEESQVDVDGSSYSVSSCSHITMIGCAAFGDFRQAALHIRSAENIAMFGCTFENLKESSEGDGEAWAAIFDGNGSKTVTSDYRTGWSSGRASFTVNNYTSCRFTKPNGKAGPTVYMTDMANFQMNQCYITNASGSAIEWAVNSSFDPYSIRLEVQVETTGNNTFIEFDGVSGNPDCVINGLEILNGGMYTEDNYFLLSNFGTGSLTINNLRVQVNKWQGNSAPTNFVNGGSLLTVFGGHIVTPSLNDVILVNLAGYEGWHIGLDGTTRHYGDLDKRTGSFTQYYGHLFEAGTGSKATVTDDTVFTITLADDSITDSGVFLFWSRNGGVAATIAYKADSSPAILMETLGANVETVTNTTLSGTTGNDTKVTIAVNDGEIQIENRRGFSVTARWAFISG